MFDVINIENLKIKIAGILNIDIVRGVLLFLSLILTPSAAINILNQANNNINELSFINNILLYTSLIINLMLIVLVITDKLCSKFEFPRSVSIISSAVLSFIISLFIVMLAAPIATKYTVNNHIYNDKVNNLANISASIQYHSLNEEDKITLNNTFDIKRDLLDNIVEIEHYEFDRENLYFENLTFLNLIGILIYTDPKIIDSYSEQLPLILEKKQKIFAKQEFEKYYGKYKDIALKRKNEHNKQVDLYNAKLKKLKTMQTRIDQDYKELNNILEQEWSKHQGYVTKIEKESNLFADDFVNKKKKHLVRILEKIVTNGKCKNERCRNKAIKEYENNFGYLTNNYDYWLSLKKPTTLNYLLEQTTQLVFSGGMALIYQLNPKYHTEERSKMAKYLVNDNQHYFDKSKVIYFLSHFGNKSYPLEYDISKQDFKESKPVVNKVIKLFKNKYGYEINGTSIKNKNIFNKVAKEYYASKITLNKPTDFKIFEQEISIQQELKNNLGEYYNSGMKLNIEPENFKKNIIEKKLKKLEIKNESTQNKFIETLYPYHLIIITVVMFAISVLSSIIAVIFNRDLINLIFVMIIGYVVFFPNGNYKLEKLESFVDKVESNSQIVKLSINMIIFTYPKLLDIEEIKEKYYLNFLTDGYEKSKTINKPK